MTNTEYRKFREHILDHMELDDLKDNLKRYKERYEANGTLWGAVETMCQDGCFDVYYGQVLDTLKDVYGEKYDESKYLTKDGDIRFKNNTAYCWTIYKAKLAKTIENMEKNGEI